MRYRLLREAPLRRPFPGTLAVAATVLALAGCGDAEPAAPASAPLEAPAATEMSRAFQVVTEGSSVDFIMEAPLENIHGRAPSAAQGELNIDLMQLAESSALVRFDLFQLEVLQQKRESADEAFGAEVRNETQNEHVRTWFEISPDAPEDVREANRWVEYRVESIDNVSQANIMEMSGAERVVQATLHGQLRIHGHTLEKAARVELAFAFAGDVPTSVRVRSLEPVNVGLEEYDIHPRSAFGTLAQRTLAALGEKVATSAPVTFEFTANVQAAGAEAPPAQPAGEPSNEPEAH